MDRSKYPVSVVPFPADRTQKARVVGLNEEAAWDSKWLRPNVAVVGKSNTDQKPEPQAETEEERPSLTIRVLRWLFPEVNQRRAKRFPTPGLVAYYWTGGAPHSYHVGDMSATGLFLLTKERWAPGTLIQMTLQVQDGRVHHSDNSICVLTEVVRWGDNGAGFNFILADYENVLNCGIAPTEAIDRKSVERFLGKMGAPVDH
jgi:PilZ domain